MMYTGEKYPNNLINSSYLYAVAMLGDQVELEKLLATNYRLDNLEINPLSFLLTVKEQSPEHIRNTVNLLINYSNKQPNSFITKNTFVEDINLSLNIAERLFLEERKEFIGLIDSYVSLREDFLQDLTQAYIKLGKKKLLKPIEELITSYNYCISNNNLVQHILLIKGLNYKSDLVKNTYERRLMDVLDIYMKKPDNSFSIPESRRQSSGLNFMSMIATNCSSIELLEYCINLIDFDVQQIKNEVTNAFRKNSKNSVPNEIYNYIHNLNQSSVEAVREHFLLNKSLTNISKQEKKFKL